MIQITNPADCCGCEACTQICPKQCVSMQRDGKGFLYPEIDKAACIECGLCEQMCPVLNPHAGKAPLQIFAAKNPDESERRKSSSGGIFTLLAKLVIQEGGVVFGAAFDEHWMPVHTYADSVQDIKKFQGSKYVQSRIDGAYIQARSFLASGRKVLFSGTPCQVAGLKHFLRKEYEQLLTVEVVCHGVPSPLVWQDYLYSLTGTDGHSSSIKGISFRDKQTGWQNYSISVHFSDGQREDFTECYKDNLYMKCFLADLCLRPSCFHCAAKGGKSQADISLGDFWSIRLHLREFDDDKGVTLVHINSEKGQDFYRKIQCRDIELDPSVKYNPMYSENVTEKYPADKFWKSYAKKGIRCIPAICKSMQPSRPELFLRKVKNKVKNIFTLFFH